MQQKKSDKACVNGCFFKARYDAVKGMVFGLNRAQKLYICQRIVRMVLNLGDAKLALAELKDAQVKGKH